MNRFFLLCISLALSACSSVMSDPDTIARQEAQIEQLEQKVSESEERVDALQSQVAAGIEQLAAAQSEVARSREHMARVLSELESLQNEQSSAPGEVDRMHVEVEQARAAQLMAEANLRSVEATNAELRSSLEASEAESNALSERYDEALLALTSFDDPNRLSANVEVQDVDADVPRLKKVYYATNRVRLNRSLSDYLKTFISPLIALILTILLLRVIRKFIKERYQTRAQVFVIVFGGAATLVTTGLALQSILQMWQSDDVLHVQYGNEIRQVAAGETPYEHGWVEVSIPPKRVAGDLPVPNLVKFEFVVDPIKHFQLASVQPSTSERFYSDLEESLSSDPQKSAFIFIHGFHNTFQDAAFRTAQMAHDMDFRGAPIFFSWPSQGTVLDYLTDAKNVETSVLHLKQFLQEVHKQSGASRIHLIAHSMGSRALAQAVEDLAGGLPAGTDTFGKLVFAAPDIAKDLLEQKIATLDQMTDGVTLYASAHDSALLLSRALQGGDENNYQRAGETHPSPMVAPPMQTVDVSLATKGHSYVADSRAMLNDLAGLLAGSRELSESSENYVPTGVDSGYWLLEAD